ncbi:hypothetical protein KIL84_007170 [Mauremys mutica]|uniref:Uncharacterized protein n=1 Tax=Mauremys mutica TaxID=74926 RepID=A0A9D4APW8_9SAUR|nr:hypothetical protein KIL84_007170 [Mauremys mutica]
MRDSYRLLPPRPSGIRRRGKNERRRRRRRLGGVNVWGRGRGRSLLRAMPEKVAGLPPSGYCPGLRRLSSHWCNGRGERARPPAQWSGYSMVAGLTPTRLRNVALFFAPTWEAEVQPRKDQFGGEPGTLHSPCGGKKDGEVENLAPY